MKEHGTHPPRPQHSQIPGPYNCCKEPWTST